MGPNLNFWDEDTIPNKFAITQYNGNTILQSRKGPKQLYNKNQLA